MPSSQSALNELCKTNSPSLFVVTACLSFPWDLELDVSAIGMGTNILLRGFTLTPVTPGSEQERRRQTVGSRIIVVQGAHLVAGTLVHFKRN